jgi:sortase (surface protein transpeptidase)
MSFTGHIDQKSSCCKTLKYKVYVEQDLDPDDLKVGPRQKSSGSVTLVVCFQIYCKKEESN